MSAPYAYAVEQSREPRMVTLLEEHAEAWIGENSDCAVVPLYRHQQPTLTDEERWCLKEMLVLIAFHHEDHQQAAFILRDLLRRTK